MPSVLTYGDMSVLSFHATKVFTTFEGGAIVCNDAKTKQRIDHLKNFGFADEVTVVAPGINGKMNEWHAALGLLQLKHLDAALAARASIDQRYRHAFDGVTGLRLCKIPPGLAHNYAYFPILIEPDFPISRDALYDVLRSHDIYARRYSHPLISEFPTYRGLPSAKQENLPVATKLANQVLCLPIYPALGPDEQVRIIDIILSACGRR